MKRKSIFIAFLALLASTGRIAAHDFEMDGIYYNITSSTAPLTVAVTYQSSSYSAVSGEYSGDINIPESVSYNGGTYSVTSINAYAFCNCTSLTSIVIPNSITSIGNYSFNDCTNLRKVVFSNGTTDLTLGYNKQQSTSVSSNLVGHGLFYDCPLSYLYIGRNLVLPESTVNISYGYPFYGPNTNIKKLYIGEPVTSFNGTGCLGPNRIDIEHVYCYATNPPSPGIYYGSLLIFVPSNAVSTYKTTSRWGTGTYSGTTREVYPLDLCLTDGEPFVNSVEEREATTITYQRRFSHTAWQALYVPFEMQYNDWKNDFDFAYINDIHQFDDNDDGKIDRTQMEVIYLKEGKTEANTPYLIKAKNTYTDTEGYKFTLNDVILYPAEENTFDVSSWYTRFNFKGTYSGISAADMLSNGYYAMGDGKLNQSDPNTPAPLKSYRWYMQVTDRNGVPKDLGHEVKIMVLDEWGIEEETDGIEFVQNSKPRTPNEEAIYDLSGRQMVNGQVKKGIYIKNGKKVVIK